VEGVPGHADLGGGRIQERKTRAIFGTKKKKSRQEKERRGQRLAPLKLKTEYWGAGGERSKKEQSSHGDCGGDQKCKKK